MEYADGMLVEIFDHVDVRIAGRTFEGQITRLHQKRGLVTVRYADHSDVRRDGDPKRKTAQVPLPMIELVRRDG